MSYVYTQLGLVYPHITTVDAYGNATTSYPNPWSKGFRVVSKAPSVRRVKPSDLLSSLTGYGTHEREIKDKKPYSFQVVHGDGSVTSYHDVEPEWYSTVGQVGLYPPEPNWQTKLRLQIKDQKINLAQAVAEYPQAQRMFANNATTIANALRALRRGEMKKVFNTLGLPRKKLRGTVSNRWLELQYGWLPLLSDLHGAVEELQQSLQRPRTRRVTARATSQVELDVQNGWYPHLQERGTIHAEAKATAKAVCYIQQESLAASRLGVTNPLNLAWELLPYSFVIDWFIPIGNWLNSLDAGIGLGAIRGTVTTKTKYVATNHRVGVYQYETYSRSVFYDLPAAPLPRYSPSVGFGKVTNALALLSQLKR